MAPTTLERTGNINYVEDTIRFPEGMRFVFAPDNDLGSTFERDAMLLYPYVIAGRISTGRVAEILGTDRLSVIDFYENSGLPWLNYGVEELEHDLATMRRLGILSEEE